MQNRHIAALAVATALAGAIAGYVIRPATPAAEEAHTDEHADGDEEEAAASTLITVTPAQLRAAGIETARVTDAPLAGEVTASGQIIALPSSQAKVTARTSGVVTRLLVKPGDSVSPGTALAVIDSREVAEAQAAYARAAREHQLAQATFAREELLYEQKVTARADYDQARAALDGGRITRDAAAEALRALGAVPGGASRLMQIRSPITGRVTAVETTPGAFVAAESPLFEIANQRVVWAELSVPGRDAARVRAGQRVEVTPQGERHSHPGHIEFVTPAIDPASGAAKTVVELPNGNGELAIGQLVTARIISSQGGPSGLMIPRDALQEVEGRSVVFVRRPNGFEARTIIVRPGTSDRTAVLSGLRAGEEIAVVNSFVLKAELMKGAAEHAH